MIWGAMSSAGVGPLCFLKTNVTAPVYQDILEHFMLPSADQLFKDADFISQQDLTPDHTENLWGIVKRKMRNKRPKKCRLAEDHSQRSLGFHTTSAVPKTDHLQATPN